MSTKFSVLRLLSNLANSAPPPPTLSDEEVEGDKVNTTIRLEPAVRKFVEEQAEHYGISSQQFISMMLKGLMSGGSHEMVHQASLMESRIYDLFSRNNLSPVQAAAVLSSFGITASILKDPQKMLSLATPEMVSFLSEKFGVRRDWLCGVSDEAFGVVSFDKQPLQFILHILDNAVDVRNVKVNLVFEDGYKPLESEGEYGWADCKIHAGFVVELKDSAAGVARYIISRQQPWGYVRTRTEIKTILYFLERGIDIRFPVSGYQGWLVRSQEFDRLFSGKAWPDEVLKFHSDWARTGITAGMCLDDLVDQDGHSLEEFEAKSIANNYTKTKLPLIHEFYREKFSCNPEQIRQHLFSS